MGEVTPASSEDGACDDVWSALAATRDELAAAMTVALRESIPFYAERQSEFRRADLMMTLGASVDALVEYGRERRVGAASERLLEINRQRTREGVPLEVIQDAWRVGGREVWKWLQTLDLEGPRRHELVHEAWSTWLEFLDLHSPKVTGVYLEARREADLAESVAVSYTMQHLFREAGPAETERTLRRLGVNSDTIAVAVFAAGQELAGDDDPMRRFSPLIQAASALSRGRTPTMFQEQRLVMLIPGESRAVEALTRAASTMSFKVTGGVSRRAPLRTRLIDLFRQAELALSGSTPGNDVVDFDSLPMTRVIALTSRITWADLPSWMHHFFREDTRRAGEWMQTVHALWHSMLHVRTAAESLHVHSNTVYYRLGAVERECGVDLREPAVLMSVMVVDECRAVGSLSGLPLEDGDLDER